MKTKVFLRWSTRKYCLYIFAIALLIRIPLLLMMRLEYLLGDSELVHLARSIALHGEYANPYLLPTGPTAHYSPGAPLFLAFIFRLFGTGTTGLAAFYYVNVLFSAGQYALLPLFASVLEVPIVWGGCGGILGAVIPFNFMSEARSGESLSGFILLIMAILTIHVGKQLPCRFNQALLHGMLWGAALLIAPSGLLLLIPILLTLGWKFWPNLRALTAYTSTLLVGMGIALSPWVIRNEVSLGAPILLRSNLGLELAVSYNDTAAVTIDNSIKNGTFGREHPYISESESQRVRNLGEVKYMRQKMAEAINWIRNHPARAAKLTFLHAISYWFPITLRPMQTILTWVLSAIALLGIPIVRKFNRFAGMTLSAICAIFPVTYWFVNFAPRYRLQILFAFLLPAGASIIWALERFGVRLVSKQHR